MKTKKVEMVLIEAAANKSDLAKRLKQIRHQVTLSEIKFWNTDIIGRPLYGLWVDDEYPGLDPVKKAKKDDEKENG